MIVGIWRVPNAVTVECQQPTSGIAAPEPPRTPKGQRGRLGNQTRIIVEDRKASGGNGGGMATEPVWWEGWGGGERWWGGGIAGGGGGRVGGGKTAGVSGRAVVEREGLDDTAEVQGVVVAVVAPKFGGRVNCKQLKQQRWF